ncbi:hypothetical protein NDA16_004903 [Ustilago loliicola]|nr:hypothetical protein NDA16_004903 [Ustilago loliicola]
MKASRLPSSKARPHASAPAASNTSERGIMSLLLTPFLALAFAILHIVYQSILLVRSTHTAIINAFKRDPNRLPASYTSLQDLLDAHETPSSAVRAPKHLAVVLADAVPSSIRLYVSTMLMRITRNDATSTADLWRDFRYDFQAAVEAKHVNDMASIIHLARISGAQQLSMYTTEPLSPIALQSLSRALQVGYKTQAVISQGRGKEAEQTIEQGAESRWSRYAELRRRRTMKSTAKSSDSSSPSSLGSPASSDSEAGLSSLDETLASSYTADNDGQLGSDAYEATVHIRLGLDPPSMVVHPKADDDTDRTGEQTLLVTLLSQEDGQERFAQLVSQQVRSRADTYLSDVLLPDMDAAASAAPQCRFSSSSLRKAWVSKRKTFTSELTVAELDKGLAEAGYMGEPELLVVFGGRPRLRKLHGFPAWPVRLTDLFYDANMQSHKPYGGSDFVAALKKLAKTEQRYGR